ncbi:hypothetical protein EJD97_014980 [Solanum chilense]|uniref:Uncharacterized protein n=1 Tax=Solanum chilense TaxID=4083 RepID=A0A6N2BD15_SOLCI|nr:hypothetical protein EJD97_014980 [Solanum chilense]
MTPKQNRVYARGRSMSIAPSSCLVSGSDDERDTRERTLTGTHSGSTTNEGVSGSLGVSWLEEDFGSAEVLATAAESASFDEADSSESTPDSPTCAVTPVTDQSNRWCVDGQYQVYSDAMFLNDKRVMTWTLTLEQWVLTGSLPMMPEIHNLYTRHRLEWTARPLGHYSEELVDISMLAIRRFLYGENVDANRTPLTAEFDYRGQIVKDGQFLRNNKKGQPDFHGKVFVVDCPPLPFLQAADNMITWDRAVLMAMMIPGFEVDFAWLIQADRTATQATSTDTTPIESIPGSSTAPSSSCSAPLTALVPLARFHKLEAQMATHLHYILPWMQRSIAEAEERLDRKMVQHTKRKIVEVHQRLEAFELRVLACTAPPVDAPFAEPAEDTVMATLFPTSEIPPPPTRENAKRCRVREEDEYRARKKEHREMEAARRASLAEEEAHPMRVGEEAGVVSSSRTVEIAGCTADSAVDAEDTLECIQITEVVGSAEPDPPTY